MRIKRLLVYLQGIFGFLYVLGAYYMPLAVRLPHTMEILADSFAYAGLLVVLLAEGDS